MIKISGLFFLLLLLSFCVEAQVVSGVVRDEKGEPIPGVNIVIKNTYIGVVADQNGGWKMQVQPGKYVLVFSLIGFTTVEKEVLVQYSPVEIETVLQESVTQLNEALIVADTRDLGRDIMRSARENRKNFLHDASDYRVSVERKLSLMRSEPRNLYDSIREATADSLGKLSGSDMLKTPKERRAERKAERRFRKEQKRLRKMQADTMKRVPDTVRVEHIGSLNESIITQYVNKGQARDVVTAENKYELADFEDYIYISLGYDEEGLEIDDIQFIYDEPYMLFKTAEDWNFNFYEPQLRKEMLCQQPLVSPLSPMGPTLYKYDYAGLRYDDSTKIFKIKITPLFPNDALFTGYIYIRDQVFSIDEVDFSIDPRALTMVNTFRIQQQYLLIDSTRSVPVKTVVEYSIKEGSVIMTTTGTSLYDNYIFNADSSAYPGQSLEMVRYEESALDRDTLWWEQHRKIALTLPELKYGVYVDSLRKVFTGEEFTRKLDSAYNHISIWSFVYKGVGHRNRERQTQYYFGPIPSQMNFFGIGGYRHNINSNFSKRFKNENHLQSSADLSYGFNNHDLRGRLGIGYTYVPKKFVRTYLRFGDFYDMINYNPSITSAFSRSNYARTKMFSVAQRMEVFNGFFAEISFEHSDQQAISGLQMDGWSNQLFGDINEPIDFDRYIKSEFKLNVVYRIGQRYMMKGNRKILLGSRWPDLSFTWRKGIPGLMRSEVDFDYLEFSASDYIKLNRYGTSNWSFMAGSFVNARNLRILENKYFRGSDKYIFSNPLNSFQLLGPTLSSSSAFVRGNYIHHFEGIFDKVPLIGRMKMSVAGGFGFLLMEENHFRHGEFFAGLEKPVRIRRELFRIGVYAITSDNNINRADFTLKFGISTYNLFTRKWDF